MDTEPSAGPMAYCVPFFADLARLALVDIADAADEAALQVAEGVAAHPLDLQLRLDLLAQQVGQRAAAGELNIAVGVVLEVPASLVMMGAPPVVDAFGDRAITQRPWRSRWPSSAEETLQHEGSLGQVDPGAGRRRKLLAERRGGGEAGMPPHHHREVDAGQRGVVEVGARRKAWATKRAAAEGKPGVGRCRPCRCRSSSGCGCCAAGSRPWPPR